ncbi:MAG: hypothetical protein NUV91_02235, partial [Candidatus Omnitrophica bacterium]|nr:hypothetical protein [Candidatus Omnitrophota bacterium]
MDRKGLLKFLFISAIATTPLDAEELKNQQKWDFPQGISLETVYTGEFWRNQAGGIKEDETYIGNLDVALTLDTQELSLWNGGTFFFYFLDNHGGEKLTSSIVGDLQTVSNIEAPRTARL